VTDAGAALQHAAARRSVRFAEWRNHWPLLIAATVGMSMSGVGYYSFGVLLPAIHEETGWSRSAITFGSTISAALAAVLAPVGGMLMDRFGPRRIAIPGVILYGIGMSAFALIERSLLHYYAMFVVLSIAFIGLKPLTWTGALAKVFIETRALAFAVAISGISIGGTFVPSIANYLVQHYGWRGTYVGLGLIWSVLVLPFCFLLPRNLARAPGAGEAPSAATAPQPAVQGVPVARAVRSAVFLKLAFLGLFLTIGFSAVTWHFVPLLRDRGIDPTTAAAIAVALPIIPILLLLTAGEGSVTLMTLLAVLVGLSAGCEIDLLAYMLTRHFGLRNYGTLFGIMMIALAVGTALGPLAASAVRDHAGTYDPILWAVIPCFLLSALAVATTGPYPDAGEGARV
jgi:MFS family permease